MRQVTSVNWACIGDALPAFVTIVSMPLTYSVAYGLIAGLLVYTVLNGMIFITSKLSRGRVQPPDRDNAEYWTINPVGGTPPWFIRFSQRATWRMGRLDNRGVDGDGASVGESTGASERELVEGKDMVRGRVQEVM